MSTGQVTAKNPGYRFGAERLGGHPGRSRRVMSQGAEDGTPAMPASTFSDPARRRQTAGRDLPPSHLAATTVRS
jgi:hypothetical protein